MKDHASPRYLLLLLAVALAATACGSGDDGSATTTIPVTLTTTSSTSTTTTTVAETTTSSSTTTTTLSETTTTTVPAVVELSDEGVQAGDEWVYFGYDDDDTVAAIEAVLGAPTKDTGWIDAFGDYGVCHPPMLRVVEWGSFVTLYTNGDTDFWLGGVEHFYGYYYTDATNPPDLRTTEDIGIGSTLGDLKAAYDPAKIEIDEAFFDPSVGFWSYDLQSWTGMWGYATGQGDVHVITSINGGRGCGE